MSQALQKFEEKVFSLEVLSQLSELDKAVALSMSSSDYNPRFSEMNKRSREEFITELIFGAVARLDMPAIPIGQVVNLTGIIISDLDTHYPGLRKDEIERATNNGLLGLYKSKPDERIWFNVSNLFQWIAAYIVQTKNPVSAKILALEERHRKSTDKSEISEEDALKHSLTHYTGVLEKVMVGGKYEDYGNVVYMFLEKIGLLGVGNQEAWYKAKWEAIDRAEQAIKQEAIDSRERNKIKNAIQLAEKAREGNYDHSLIVKAKKIIIDDKIQEFLDMDYEDKQDYMDAVRLKVDNMIEEIQLKK